MPIYRLTPDLIFPPVEGAVDGIVAVGGDLSTDRLLLAYSSGIFPWFSADEPIIWWSPDPRFVLFPDKLKVSKSMQQLLKRNAFRVTMDKEFRKVIEACSRQKRHGQAGTWITPKMLDAYIELHDMGLAHSVEVWDGNKLVGGLYGVALGKIFFGESMFFKASNASKYGFIKLVRFLKEHDFTMIDCQVETSHLASLGAEEISRASFLKLLKAGLKDSDAKGSWADRQIP